MTFIIHFKDGHNNRYDEDVEHERDAAWDDVYMTFPDAEYIWVGQLGFDYKNVEI